MRWLELDTAAPIAYDLANAALRAYDISPSSVTWVRTFNNVVFRVDTSKAAYALRLHRPGYRNIAQMRSQLHFLQQLRVATDMAVPQPVPARDGEWVVTISSDEVAETIHADLLTWLDGRNYRPGEGLGPHRVFKLGAALGRMHTFASQFVPTEEFELPHWDADGLFTSPSPSNLGLLDDILSTEELVMFDEVANRVRVVFAKIGKARNQWGIIHADFILGNCQFRGYTPQILDFDDCGFGYFLYDLGPLLGNLKDYEEDYGYRAIQLRHAFVDGYRSQRALSATDEAHLDLLIAARHAHACLRIADRVRSGVAYVHAVEHQAYRMYEVRKYLEKGT
jgi:Ser/Thr protein kinase RdoA (MazF antagonist)